MVALFRLVIAEAPRFPELAKTHFALGMISNFAFWPRLLLPHWSPTKAATQRASDEAVETMLARYSAG